MSEKVWRVGLVGTRLVHKNLFLEFPRMPKTFFLNFQECQAVLCYILIDKQMLEKVFAHILLLLEFWEPPVLQSRIHGVKLPESGLGHNF